MKLRYARHTKDLSKMEAFYTGIAGLSKLGGFKDHAGYDGLFLGFPDGNWQIEFTVSADVPEQRYDEDDLLVFYVFSEIEMEAVRRRIKRAEIQTEIPKNPYWTQNGIMIADPDGYRIVFSMVDKQLNQKDDMTGLVNQHGIETWNDLLNKVRKLPYGRNENRADFSLVLKEQKGTCSSKHALLKKIADLNGISGVKLVIGMYKMNQNNTPKIGNLTEEHGLEYIPEAHCYLIINNQRIDITAADSSIENLMKDILCEQEIEPEQVNEFKVEYHRQFLKNWLCEQKVSMTFEQLWEVREQCIDRLSQ